MTSNIVKLPIPSSGPSSSSQKGTPSQVAFQRQELSLILNVYGQMVSSGDWKDYGMSFLKDRAVFAVYRS